MKRLRNVLIVLAVIILLPYAILVVAIPFNYRTPSETDLSKSALLKQAPARLASEVTLKVVTFNIHDLYLIARDRADRMMAIGADLKNLDPDIVGFQEAWIAKDRQILRDSMAGSRLTYSQYYPSGVSGSGLFILSAYPITENFFHRYVRNGKWYKPYHEDWWGGKGVALARIQLPGGAILDFYDTHAHASYGSSEYDGDREAQMQEMAAFIKASSLPSAPAIAVGDFNCHPDSQPFQILTANAPARRLMSISTGIDHILGVDKPGYALEVVDTSPIQRRIQANGHQTDLSDHNGYISIIRIRPE